MYLIDINKIENGDIFLVRSNSDESVRIRKMSGSDYSHAILYVGVSSCIESDGYGVVSRNLQRILFESEDDLLVLRLKNEYYDRDSIRQAIIFARQKIGTEYSSSEARMANRGTNSPAKNKNRQFCTRFVAQAFKNGEIKLVENPDYCSPKELQFSDKLEIIKNILRPALKEEIEFAKSEDPTKKQMDIQNFILDGARQLSNNDIQTHEQLAKYVIENPQSESKFIELLKKSGYLNLWEEDFIKNPEYYNFETFKDYFKNPNQRFEVGDFLATTEEETRSRFEETLKTLKFCYKFRKQTFFKLQIDLYEKLIELSKKRQEIGLKAISG